MTKIIEEKQRVPLSSVKPGQPFRFPSNTTTVFVRADGLPPKEGRIPVVVLIDSDQHESQGSYTKPGVLIWSDPTERVELLEMSRTPIYKVL